MTLDVAWIDSQITRLQKLREIATDPEMMKPVSYTHLIRQAGEEKILFALERIDCQPIEHKNAGLSLEVLHDPYAHGMAGNPEAQSGLWRGARLCGVDCMLAQRVRDPVEKLSIDILVRLRDQMVAARLDVRSRRMAQIKGQGLSLIHI